MNRNLTIAALMLVLLVGITSNVSAQTMEIDYARYLAEEAQVPLEVEIHNHNKTGPPVAEPSTTYTFVTSYSTQSTFQLFGDTASTNPIRTVDLTVERNGWSAEIIFVDGVNKEQNEGDLVRYYDVIVSKSCELGILSCSVGLEVFYGPAQLGSESATFIAPLATATWEPNDHFSIEVGGQWVGTHRTPQYDSDRFFGWLRPKASYGVGRFSGSISPGYILADTGRSTLFVEGDVTFAFNDHFSAYVSYLEAKSWKMTGVPGVVPIDGTWTYGATFNF
jgi:hypothetical protein